MVATLVDAEIDGLLGGAGDLVEAGDEKLDVNYNAFDEGEDGDEDDVAGDLVEACDEEWNASVREAGCQLNGQR